MFTIVDGKTKELGFIFPKPPKVVYKSWRDQMIQETVEDINLLRIGTPFEKRKETSASLARRINVNPFLAGQKNDGELALVLKGCQEKRNYGHLYMLLKQK